MRDRLAAVWRLLRIEHGWSRVWVSLGMAITMAGGGLIYYTTQEADPPSDSAHLWMDGDGGTCGRVGSPETYDNDGDECDTFAEAYSGASSGDTIGVKGATYSSATLDGSTKTLTYRVQTGDTAYVTGSSSFGSFSTGLQHVDFYGPFVSTQNAEDGIPLKTYGCTSDIELHDWSGDMFDISDSTSNLSFYGGTWGNYDGHPYSSDSTISGALGYADPWEGCGNGIVTNILFEGVHFTYVQFYPAQWGGAHPDCVESSGSTNTVTFRNNVFDHCGNTFIGWYTDWGNNENLLVENNLMYKTSTDTLFGIQIGTKTQFDGGRPGIPQCSVVFRHNTFDPDEANAAYAHAPPLIDCSQNTGSVAEDTKVYGNTFRKGEGDPNDSCSSPNGAIWEYNVWEIGPSCGTNSVVGTAGYVNRGTDYHLDSGAYALGKGKPGSAPTDFPAVDFEGTSRTSPPDAGYDER